MKSLKSNDPKNQREALEIAFAVDYDMVWGDWGSGAKTNFTVWKPKMPPGFYALGHFAKAGYDAPDLAMLVVKGLDSNAVSYPKDYKRIWAENGSGADMDGSFWEPVPKPGYKALGSVAAGNYNKPPLDAVVCVREDLITIANVGERIWGDWGAGSDSDVTFYRINAPSPSSPDDKSTFITPGSFCGHSSYAELKSSPVAYALKVELPITKKKVTPVLPILNSVNSPAEKTKKLLSDVSYMPCTVVKDSAYKGDVKRQVTDTPFYSIEKYVYYKLQKFSVNGTDISKDAEFSVATGMSESSTETVTNTVGVSVTAGYSSGSASPGPNFSVTLSYSLALTESTTKSMMRQETSKNTYPVPAHGAGAIFTISYEYILKRGDGSEVKRWELDSDNIYFTAYDPAKEKAGAV